MSNSYVNKFGLSRDIPAKIKREVRQRCGFGCVHCGGAIYQYEHVDPEFADAREHKSDCIVLLCGGCHDRVTRKLLSKQTIKRNGLSPKCKDLGFSFGPFDIGQEEPEIVIGGMRFKNVTTLIRIYGESIFSVSPPEEEGGPFRINAVISDRDGRELLHVKENEWLTNSENWDVEVVGQRIVIKKSLGDIVLSIRSNPPNGLIIEKIDMLFHDVRISGEENKSIQYSKAGKLNSVSQSMEVEGFDIGLDFHKDGLGVGLGNSRGCRTSFRTTGSVINSPLHPHLRPGRYAEK